MLSLEYLAGFFDGEGCVIIADRKSRQNRKRNETFIKAFVNSGDDICSLRIKQVHNRIWTYCGVTI